MRALSFVKYFAKILPPLKALTLVLMLLTMGARSEPKKPVEDEVVPAAVSPALFTKGEDAFNAAKKTLLSQYYRAGLTEDELYRAATVGLLQYVDPALRRWNTLLSPAEVKELLSSLKGEIVGVGIALNFSTETGYGEVLDVLPQTAAEKAGVRAGDLIVSVNGKLYKGLTLDDLVRDIRGKVGDVVKLTALRGDKLLPFALTRARVTFDAVDWNTLPLAPEGAASAKVAGVLFIRSFTEKTPALVEKALVEFEQVKTAAVVIDLRGNHGGSFEDALTVTEHFVVTGKTMVRLQMREGEQSRVSKRTPHLASVPLAVLVDDDTASGAELFAAALRDSRGATIVGQRTFGKGTLQRVEELPNGYGIKYTVGLFSTPGGKAIQTDGLVPDVEVQGDEAVIERSRGEKDPKRRVAMDGQLRTALGLLSRR